MPDKKLSTTRRWTFSVPEEETMPKGSVEFATKAIKLLSPVHKKQEDAERLGPWTAFGRHGVSEELAVDKILSLAIGFNRQMYLSEGAPRVKDVLRRLLEVEEAAGHLSRLLQSLDDYSRSALKTAGSGIADFPKQFNLPSMEEAEADQLPNVGDAGEDLNESGWVRALAALSQYANTTQRNFLISRGIESVDSADKGGSTDLYKHLYGTARWGLVTGGWYVYEMFKPGQATGTVGGPFHCFLQAVFEYATGLDAEQHAKLEQFLKSVVTTNRRMMEILREESELYEKSLEIEQEKIPYEERCRKLKKIAEKEILLEQERYELWARVHPYTYGRQNSGKPTATSGA